MIKKQGDKYVLTTRDGSRVLGTHASAQQAYAQEAAIKHAQARRAGREK